jgi:hypothetical protein
MTCHAFVPIQATMLSDRELTFALRAITITADGRGLFVRPQSW